MTKPWPPLPTIGLCPRGRQPDYRGRSCYADADGSHNSEYRSLICRCARIWREENTDYQYKLNYGYVRE